MAKSVRELPADIKDSIDIHEWDMRTIEGHNRCKELKATCLPAIALDNELIYESIIPAQNELISEINKRLLNKINRDTS